jgi:hypothetical protein
LIDGKIMEEGLFQFEDCLLKHYVRTTAWLPLCKQRLNLLRKNRKEKSQRRLRYFTFPAIGAIDVLMLEMAKVVKKSVEGRFDTVYFFDRTRDLVDSTTKRIPGANGFPGDFVSIVLAEDPFEDSPVGALEAPAELEDTAETRERQRLLSTRRSFIQSFPFDVINLDLESFLFRPTNPPPGKLVNAMRQMFAWQKRPLQVTKRRTETIDGFSLMFTTQVGPPNLTDDYHQILLRYLQDNIEKRQSLAEQLESRTGYRDLGRLQAEQFALFFKLAAPKLIASLLDEQDWYVDSSEGIRVFEFERQWELGAYSMLHLVMQVQRKQPPQEKRASGQDSTIAKEAYIAVVDKLFTDKEVKVTDGVINKAELQTSLNAIKERRKRIYPEGE